MKSLLEDWRDALDRNHYAAAILMDLSRAFGCSPHDILLSNLSAYDLSEDAINRMFSYLSERKQQVKISKVVSKWAEINKVVPQGSILGSLLLYVFINDIFYFTHRGTLYNYTEDNTLSFHSANYNFLISTLQSESEIFITWFHFNYMKVNPEKFQAIAVGQKKKKKKKTNLLFLMLQMLS